MNQFNDFLFSMELQDYMDNNSLSADQMSDKIGIASCTFRKYLRCASSPQNLHTYYNICKVLGKSLDHFFTGK